MLPMKNKFFGANWKMNLTTSKATDYFKTFEKLFATHSLTHKDIVFFPPMQLLAFIHSQFNQNIKVGSQNFYPQKQGAFTGEVSADMLLEDGISWVLIGHSERRSHLQEQDSLIKQKVLWALENNLNIVLCCGEDLSIRENGQEKTFIQKQLLSALEEVNPSHASKIVIAYEPIWAIGTGKVATSEQIGEMHQFLDHNLSSLGFNTSLIRIIYGGSVNAQNAKEILSIPYVDGTLVGSASLNPKDFFTIIDA
jgi:triosephosphate isomerase